MRDHLIGFPPVLLAQDEAPRKQFVTPSRDDSFNETTQEWLFRAFDVAWTKDGRSVRETDCKQVKPIQLGVDLGAAHDTSAVIVYSIVQEPLSYTKPATTTPAGVWRKTAEHQPPVGAHEVRHADGTLCFDRMFDGVRWLSSVDPTSPPSCMQTWQWLDTSGEFKVGDRVRYREELRKFPALRHYVGKVAALEQVHDGSRSIRFSDGDWDLAERLEHAS